MSTLTVEQAKQWLECLNEAHHETAILIEAALWSRSALNSMKNSIDGQGNVISFPSGKAMVSPFGPIPDGFINFESTGRKLDYLYHLLNVLLPEPEKTP